MGSIRPQRRDGDARPRDRLPGRDRALRVPDGEHALPRLLRRDRRDRETRGRGRDRLRLRAHRQDEPRLEARPSRWPPQDTRRAGRTARLRDPDGLQERPAHGDRQRLLPRGDDRPQGCRPARRQVHPRAGGGRRPNGRADPREGAGSVGGAAGRHQAQGHHPARQCSSRPGARRHQWLHRPAVPVVPAADRAGRQLHHRHRASRQGGLRPAPADPADGVGLQEPPLLLPDHARPAPACSAAGRASRCPTPTRTRRARPSCGRR